MRAFAEEMQYRHPVPLKREFGLCKSSKSSGTRYNPRNSGTPHSQRRTITALADASDRPSNMINALNLDGKEGLSDIDGKWKRLVARYCRSWSGEIGIEHVATFVMKDGRYVQTWMHPQGIDGSASGSALGGRPV